MDFVALDFETANPAWSSACAIGIAVVRGEQVTDIFSTLIRPGKMEFDKRYTKIHGIRPSDVRDSPTIAEAWKLVEERIGSLPLLAHNAAFDIGVLEQSLGLAKLTCGTKQYGCTCEISRAILPGLPNHRLPTLASVFGISIDHHDPASDARTCAELAILFDRVSRPGRLSSFLRELCDFAKSCDSNSPKSWASAAAAYLRDAVPSSLVVSENDDYSLVDRAEPDGRFQGNRFVFTGDLNFISRTDAKRFVSLQGGKPTGSVSHLTDYVVASDDELAKYARTGESTVKLNTANTLCQAGVKVQIVTEAEFIKMLQ